MPPFHVETQNTLKQNFNLNIIIQLTRVWIRLRVT